MMKPTIIVCSLICQVMLLSVLDLCAEEPVDVSYFETHIRPVLVEKCLECHSATTEINGGLALDSRPGWQKGGDSGSAIEPGKPDVSLLLKAIEYKDSELKMPPDGALSDDTVARFRKWIAAGAIDPRESEPTGKPKQVGLAVERARDHWSYRPIAEHGLPRVEAVGQGKSANAVDLFIDAKVAEEGIETSPAASDRAILRRVTFDLHGLPPTTDDLSAYERDRSPDKYERLVDRLLASPRFGERMARHWMDVARYAESVTLRGFVLPQAWRYRDYLIQVFNQDRPLDLFVREQIAGDLMDDPDSARRTEQIVATTFLAMGNTNLEEQDKDQLEMDYIDEQLEVIGRVFMGQTLGCARCHDHKFDPIPTKDYYALAGIFRASKAMEHENVSKWIERPLPVPSGDEQQYAAMEKRLAEIKADEADLEKKTKQKATTRPANVVIDTLPGIVIDDAEAQKVGHWKESSSEKPYVGTGYVHDLRESQTPKSITFEPKQLPPGNYIVRFSYTASPNRTSKATLRVFSADGEKVITIDQQLEPDIDGLWISLGEYRFEKDGQAFVLLNNDGADGHVIADAVHFLPVSEAPQLAIKTQKEQPSKSNADAVPSKPDSVVKKDDRLKELKAERAKLESKLGSRPKALSIFEKLPAKDIPVHIRGNVHNLGSVVPRGFLQCAQFEEPPKLGPDTSGRLELADWLTDERHPLVARVLANRFWLWTLGSGLVRTVDNFGTTGEAPSHPELLDYLAADLMRRDWSCKEMIRQLVLSSTYRRSVVPSERSAELDPENRLFSHSVRKRLEVEALRDAMLSLSGELNIPGAASTLEPNIKEDYRYKFSPNLRAVYQPVLRNSLPELYEAFDFPNSSISTGQRSQSVVSPQALALMNNAWVHQRALQTARRLMRNSESLQGAAVTKDQWQSICESLFQECIGRAPTIVEQYTAHALIDELEQQGCQREQILARLVHGLYASIDFRYLD